MSEIITAPIVVADSVTHTLEAATYTMAPETHAVTLGKNSALTGDGVVFAGNTVTDTNLTPCNGAAIYGATVAKNIAISHSEFLNNASGISGGAVFNQGTFTSTNNTFSHNTANGQGGAVYNNMAKKFYSENDLFTENSGSMAGAVYSYGTFASQNSTYSKNSATADGGAIYVYKYTAESTEDTFIENKAKQGGGAVYVTSNGTFTSNTSTYSGNEAVKSGGAVNNMATFMSNTSTYSGNKADAFGGAVYNGGSFTSNDSTYTLNVSKNGGGAIYNSVKLAISTGDSFTGNTVTDAQGGAVYNSGTFTSNTSSYSRNTAATEGGAIFNNGTFTSNTSTYSQNTADTDGGAVRNQGLFISICSTYTSNSSADGGAMYNSKTATSTTDLFAENTATGMGGAVNNYTGVFTSDGSTYTLNSGATAGAVYNNGTFTSNASTYSNNSASQKGGAIYNSTGKSAVFTGDVFAGNTAGTDGGAVCNYGTVTLSGDLFDGNEATDGGAIYNATEANVHINGSTFATATDSIKNNGQLYFSGNNVLNAVLDGSGLSHSEAVTSIKGTGTVGQNYVAEGHETTFDDLQVNATINGGGGTNTLIGTTLNFDDVSMTTSAKIYGAGVANEGSFANLVYVNFTGSTGMGAKALVCAGGKGAAGTSIFANSIEVTSSVESGDMGILYGGADLSAGGSFKASMISTTISGNANYLSFVGNGCRNGNTSTDATVTTTIETSIVNISGGTFNNLVYGGAYAAGDYVSCGTANMTISGGTFNFSVYGGNGGKSTATTQNGSSLVGKVFVTIDVTGDNKVAFNRHISSGSFGDGKVGETQMIIKGNGSNLSFGEYSYVSGHSQNAYHIAGVSQTFVENGSSLSFESFTGDFTGNLSNGFTNVSISSDSNVVLKGAVESDLRHTSIWNLEAGGGDAALLDWSSATGARNDFKGDTINLTLEEAFTGSKVLMNAGSDANLLTGWDSATVTLGGGTMTYNSDSKYYSGNGYKLYVDTTDGSKLMLASL